MAKEKTAIDIARRFLDNGEVSSPKNCALLQIAIEAYAEQEVTAANAKVQEYYNEAAEGWGKYRVEQNKVDKLETQIKELQRHYGFLIIKDEPADTEEGK